MNISLLMVTADGTSKDLPPLRLPFTIGRSNECKLRIPLAAVSRKHCELLEEDDELVVRDLDSSNGTYVNKDRVKKRELIPGDLLAVGPVVFVVRIDGHPKVSDPFVAYANGSVLPGEVGAAGEDIDGVPTWSGEAAAQPSATGSKAGTSAQPAPGAAPQPAAKPAAGAKKNNDDSSFESLLASLGDSDLDLDLDDDGPSKGKK